eukprot:CAMPEP_0195294404 /NCGR_PEP_ID=MMETSP0707-20130614/14867_1 /TAXON_ID=33640 /ORGANISM="Asterionellopsis glacialis, Strain CCMP134" /LENGTH=221 /DNA_ID=CAMNT_0040355363 /DNA_START=40 /DNA_END=705 /DNA_ORIENTATION=-
MIAYTEYTHQISKPSKMVQGKRNEGEWQESCQPLHCNLPASAPTISKLGFVDNETASNPITIECLPSKGQSFGDAFDDLFRDCPLAPPITTKNKKQLRFGTVGIREHRVIVGDNPSVKVGLPLQLDWDYCKEIKVDLEIFEATKPSRKRPQKLDAFQRFQRLREFQAPAQLVRAERKREQKIISLLPKSQSRKLSRYCGGGQTLSKILQDTPTLEPPRRYV